MIRTILSALCLLLVTLNISAQTDSIKVYTEQDPLVFEDSEAIWPYSFINEQGEPDGYCIDLIKMIMKELQIPYVIQLKSHQTTLEELTDGKADVILGLGSVYGSTYGHYSRTTVTLLTQSVATPKRQPVCIKEFRDLRKHQVIVKDSSLCHHLMSDYGWDQQAIVSYDPAKSIQELNEKGEGQMVWNTLTLKWLINHYQLDNLTLTPVNMPHGETKFISANQQLLDLIDKTYASLRATGRLTPLEEKWFYPDREQAAVHSWVWWMAAAALLLLALAIVFLYREIRQNRRSTKEYHQLAQLLAGLEENNKVRIWTYDIDEQLFTLLDINGIPKRTYEADEFAQRYSKEDYALLQEALGRLATPHIDDNGHEIKEETLELVAKDIEYGDDKLYEFIIHLSVLSRDSYGKPTVIIGAKRDVTKEHKLQQKNAELSLRYLSLFFTDTSGVIFFDKDGYVQDANLKAGELLQQDMDEVTKNHLHINQLLRTDFRSMYSIDGYRGWTNIGNHVICYEVKLIFNEWNNMIGLFVFCI